VIPGVLEGSFEKVHGTGIMQEQTRPRPG
jgi:hypothetical protein